MKKSYFLLKIVTSENKDQMSCLTFWFYQLWVLLFSWPKRLLRSKMCQIVMRDKKVLKFCHMVQFNLATVCVSSCEVALDIYNWFDYFQTIFKFFLLLIKNLLTYSKVVVISQFYFDFKMASTPLRTLNHP